MRALVRSFISDTSGSLLATTIKGSILVTVFSVGGAWYLNHRLEGERRAMATLSAAASGKGVDMTTTGSITGKDSAVKLDPCIILKRN